MAATRSAWPRWYCGMARSQRTIWEKTGAAVEVLTPDFKGKRHLVEVVCRAHPEIYNHNIETIERLHTIVRPQARVRW